VLDAHAVLAPLPRQKLMVMMLLLLLVLLLWKRQWVKMWFGRVLSLVRLTERGSVAACELA